MGFWGKFQKKDQKEITEQQELFQQEMANSGEDDQEDDNINATVVLENKEFLPNDREEKTETVEDNGKEQQQSESGFWNRIFKREKNEETAQSDEIQIEIDENPTEIILSKESSIIEKNSNELELEISEENFTIEAEKIPKSSELLIMKEEQKREDLAAESVELKEKIEKEKDEKEKSEGMFGKLKRGLVQTRSNIGGKIEGLLKRTSQIDDDFYNELEDILMQADVGVETTMKLVDNIRRSVNKKKIKETDQVFGVIKEEIRTILGEEKVNLEEIDKRPAVILVVGVNGVGKTTSIAKMAWRFVRDGNRVLLAAGDTFRAAAIDQLQIWADRIKVPLIKREEGSDPGAVVFDAVQESKKNKYDILIIDTAGRLQNKANLMNEIAKLRKIISREIEGAPHEVLLVLDATTGQNALSQAKQFSDMTGVTGIILTKLDGTAKGGIVIAIANELNIPVKLIGIGEGMEDLREFSADDFADALFAENENCGENGAGGEDDEDAD